MDFVLNCTQSYVEVRRRGCSMFTSLETLFECASAGCGLLKLAVTEFSSDEAAVGE